MNKILEAKNILRSAEDKSIPTAFRGSFGIKKPNISINKQNIEITQNVQKFFEDRSLKFRVTAPTEEIIKNKISNIIVDRLRFYYENSEMHPKEITTNPNTGTNLKVDGLKIDYFEKEKLFSIACIVENLEDREQKWLVYFDAEQDFGKHLDPRYIDLETSFFDIGNFPMEAIIKSPQEVYGRAIEMSKKKFEDSIKNVKELDIFS